MSSERKTSQLLLNWVAADRQKGSKMDKIMINRKNRSITISKSFEKKARVFGSPEYITLTSAQKDNPNYRLVSEIMV